MNAQEAIEITENQITEIEELIYDRVNLEEGGYISFNQRIEDQKELTDLKEALYIILESAKLFHEHSVPRMFSELKSGLGEEECKRIKTVYGVPIESVGIEVEK